MPSKNENDILKIVGVTMFEMVLGGLKYRLSGKCGILPKGPNPLLKEILINCNNYAN